METLSKYCNNIDLTTNTSKTKIFIFSRGKLKNIHLFKFADINLDVVKYYNYLGVTFNFNAKLMLQNKIFIKKDVGQCLLY